MKAIVYERYEPPVVLQIKELEKPAPEDNEVLVKVHAASVNPRDWHLMRGTPFLVGLTTGLSKPKNNIPGTDVTGVCSKKNPDMVSSVSADKVIDI